MADEPSVRDNRLRLLSEMRELFGRIADFGRMDLKRAGGAQRVGIDRVASGPDSGRARRGGSIAPAAPSSSRMPNEPGNP